MTNRVLVVGCGFPQLALLRRAKALGLRVFGVDMSREAVGVAECDDFALLSTTDEDGLVALVEGEKLRAITTTGSERALTTTAAVAARTGLPFYADRETVRRCQEKDAMRDGYRAAGLRVPAFASCRTLAEARAFTSQHGLPVVVKPARGWGQRGVARVNEEQDLPRAFEAAMAQSASAGLPVAVVEEWLEGREYSVNGWIEGGELVAYAVTERITFPGREPLGVMEKEVYPSGLSPEEEARVIDEARRGAAALGHRRGPCYSQVVLTERGPCLFETAARLGGGFDADVTRLASGVDLYTRVLGVAVGRADWEHAGATSDGHGGAVVQFLAGPPGVVRRVEGLAEARSVPGVEAAEVFAAPGGRIHPLTDAAKRAAYVLAHGAHRTAALAAADHAARALRIVTEAP